MKFCVCRRQWYRSIKHKSYEEIHGRQVSMLHASADQSGPHQRATYELSMHHLFADVGGPSDPITCTEPVQLGISVFASRRVTVQSYNEDACLHISLQVGA